MVNFCVFCGDADNAAELSHVNHGREFMRFFLSVPRLSGTIDMLPVIADRSLCHSVTPGARLRVSGELRSYNDREAECNRLKIHIWARTVAVCEGIPENKVQLYGDLCKPPVYRRTPFGREITDMMLRAPRPLPDGRPRSDYVPCIAWGALARQCADLKTRTRLELEGRFQSRGYVKQTENGPEERTAYEVSMTKVKILSIDETE